MTTTANPTPTTTLTAPLDTLPTLALPTAVIRLDCDSLGTSIRVTVPCEPIADHLAITPVVYIDPDGDHQPQMGAHHRITHLPTGLGTGGPACIACCRQVGAQLAAINGIDWGTADVTGLVDRLPTEVKDEIGALLGRLAACTQESCDDTNPY